MCFLASPSRPAVLQKAIGSCRTHHCSLKTQSTANLICRKTLPEPADVGLKHLLGRVSLPAWHCVPVHYMEKNWIPCQRPCVPGSALPSLSPVGLSPLPTHLGSGPERFDVYSAVQNAGQMLGLLLISSFVFFCFPQLDKPVLVHFLYSLRSYPKCYPVDKILKIPPNNSIK